MFGRRIATANRIAKKRYNRTGLIWGCSRWWGIPRQDPKYYLTGESVIIYNFRTKCWIEKPVSARNYQDAPFGIYRKRNPPASHGSEKGRRYRNNHFWMKPHKGWKKQKWKDENWFYGM